MIEWLCNQGLVFVVSFIFFAALTESLFPPFPSDIFMLLFAFLAGQGKFDILYIYAAAVTGSVGGIICLYYLGRTRGDRILEIITGSILARVFSLTVFENVRQNFTRHARWLILINRFLPGMRAIICFTAGLVKIKFGTVVIGSVIGVAAWNLFLAGAGFYAGRNWQQASAFMRNYSIAALLALTLALTIVVILYFRRRKNLPPSRRRF